MMKPESELHETALETMQSEGGFQSACEQCEALEKLKPGATTLKTNTTEKQVGHTPGPWKHDAPKDQIYSDSEDYKFSLICKIATGENRREEDANARLIAAAPELLEALKSLMGCYRPGLSKPDETTKWNAAKSAIAKAEGK